MKNYKGEIWHTIDIPPFDEIYDVSNYGRVRSKHNNKYGIIHKYKILKPQLNGPGYPCVILHKNKQIKMIRIHRLVAEYFIPNPKNKPEVNHKDADKTNNYYKNLEWVTGKENVAHAWKLGHCERTTAQREASKRNLEIARKRLKEIRTERKIFHEEL